MKLGVISVSFVIQRLGMFEKGTALQR